MMEPSNNLRKQCYKELGSFVGGVEAIDTRIVANCTTDKLAFLALC